MADGHLDEKAFNAVLATVLAGHNRVAQIDVETTGKFPGAPGIQPDVTIDHPGREPVLLENKYANTPERDLARQCVERLRLTWAPDQPVRAVVGLRTPQRMATVSAPELADAIRAADDFQWAAWIADGPRLPESGWLTGTVQQLAGFIDRIGTDAAASNGLTERVRDALHAAATLVEGTLAPAGFGEVLQQEPGVQTNRMAMAVLFNAVVFQSHIAEHHASIESPAGMLDSPPLTQDAVLTEWRKILAINYWPIFGVSRQLLRKVRSERTAARALETLFRAATAVANVPGSQGLIGRLFGELIADRKFLATFYTLPSSAAMLAEMAVEHLDVDWSDAAAVANLRIGDLACGTGALLTAAYARIAERHLLAGGDPSALHRRLIEDTMIGCDIMPVAVHLTAARLSGEHPSVDYGFTNTWVMPFGCVGDDDVGRTIKLGSVDLLGSDDPMPLWGDGSLAAGPQGELRDEPAHIAAGSLDLVIMNPPFTRSTNHEGSHADVPNPAFAGMGNDDEAQVMMGKALDTAIARIKGPKAGRAQGHMAAPFVDVAHAKLKDGGVLALVLPAIAVSGSSWKGARALLAERYSNITVASISSKAETATDRAFSADTGMAEVLIVARKRPANSSETSANCQARYVVINDRPSSVAHGVEIARAASVSEDARLRAGDEEIGWAVHEAFGSQAGHPTGVEQADVAFAAKHLSAGRLMLPRIASRDIPICTLRDLGNTELVHRSISGIEKGKRGGKVRDKVRGPFEITPLADRTTYRSSSWVALWEHDAPQETRMTLLPDSKAVVRPNMDDQALKVWQGNYRTKQRGGRTVSGATRLHFNNEFRVTSQPLGACITPVPALGGPGWPSFRITFLPDSTGSTEASPGEKALCVWLNTTLGLVTRWWVSSRQQQGKSRLTVTTVGTVPVLDMRRLTEEQIHRLSETFDAFENRELLPANQAYVDETRQALDAVVLCEVLGLPEEVLGPLATLRRQWCEEPSNL